MKHLVETAYDHAQKNYAATKEREKLNLEPEIWSLKPQNEK